MGLFSALFSRRNDPSFGERYCYAVVEDEHRIRLVSDTGWTDAFVYVTETNILGNYIVDARMQGNYLYVVYYDDTLRRNITLRYSNLNRCERMGY